MNSTSSKSTSTASKQEGDSNQEENSMFSQNLRFLRSVKGLSQQKLAKKIGLKRNNIASYESGIVEPKVTNFLKIVNFFDIHPAVLLNTDLAAECLRDLDLNVRNKTSQDNTSIQDILPSDANWEAFVAQTNGMRKVFDGFKQFHRFRMAKWGKASREAQLLSGDFENLLEMMNKLLQINCTLIQQGNASEGASDFSHPNQTNGHINGHSNGHHRPNGKNTRFDED